MQLQLGLALPTGDTMKGVELNSLAYKHREAVGSAQVKRPMLQLGSHSWFSTGRISDAGNKKRSFADAFEEPRDDVPRTLPLLLWDNQPNEEDDPKDTQNSLSSAFNEIDGEGAGIVGWPPIKLWRKKLCLQSQNIPPENNRPLGNGYAHCHGQPSNSMYVKVKMEGEPIARKININRFNSFQTLKHTLLGMFGKCQENMDGYKLTYQDREGDWLLTEDMPYGGFMGSVQCLKLVRSSSRLVLDGGISVPCCSRSSSFNGAIWV